MVTRILVPLDESKQARNAFAYALDHYPDASFVVLHVNNPQEWIYGDDMDMFYSEEGRQRTQESGEELLEDAEELAREHGAEVTTEMVTGKPAREIVEYAEEHDVDHVVMGSHGRSGAARILLGSVAESVVRRSPVPVTVVR